MGEKGVDEILPHLFLSNKFKASSRNIIAAYEIKTVLTVMEKPMEESKRAEEVRYEWVEMDDEASMDILTHMPTFNRIINEALERGNVLVHCLAGISRSVTAICSYLIATLGFTLPQALAVVREGRPRAGPNDGFLNQLTVFEKRIAEEKNGSIEPPESRANLHVQQIFEEAQKYSQFKKAMEVLSEKAGGSLFTSKFERFVLDCEGCGKELVKWCDLISHLDFWYRAPLTAAQLEDVNKCDSFWTASDASTNVNLNFSKPLAVVTCKHCKAELGESDAYYGVACSCRTLVCPGHQIKMDRVRKRISISISIDVAS